MLLKIAQLASSTSSHKVLLPPRPLTLPLPLLRRRRLKLLMLRLKRHTYFLLISAISTYFYLFSTYCYLFLLIFYLFLLIFCGFLSDFLLFFFLVFLYVCDFLPLKSAVSCFIAIVFRALECVCVGVLGSCWSGPRDALFCLLAFCGVNVASVHTVQRSKFSVFPFAQFWFQFWSLLVLPGSGQASCLSRLSSCQLCSASCSPWPTMWTYQKMNSWNMDRKPKQRQKNTTYQDVSGRIRMYQDVSGMIFG